MPMQLVPMCATVVITCHVASLLGLYKVQPEGILELLSNPSIKGSDAGADAILNVIWFWSLEVYKSVELLGALLALVKVCVPAETVNDGRLTLVDIPVASEPFQL